jgi:zinc/manganese transport system permease protein
MERLVEAFPLLVLPFVACVLIASLHCYMGLHVIRRGVIFVDLALAQCAALGAAVALLITPLVCTEPHVHHEDARAGVADAAHIAEQLELEHEAALHESEGEHGPHEHVATGEAHEHGHELLGYTMSLLFALLGAVLLSFGRLRDGRIPHEAVIGIIFVVAAALSVLILSKAPHGHEKMEAMLVGSILFVRTPQVAAMLILYAALGVFHVALGRRFMVITRDVTAADRSGMRVRLWDSLFYGSFALMVTQSVGVAGVFVVFSYLIIPAACASLFAERFGSQLVLAWLIAVLITVAGLVLSAVGDMPTGSSLVSCSGAALVVGAILRKVGHKPLKEPG